MRWFERIVPALIFLEMVAGPAGATEGLAGTKMRLDARSPYPPPFLRASHRRAPEGAFLPHRPQSLSNSPSTRFPRTDPPSTSTSWDGDEVGRSRRQQR